MKKINKVFAQVSIAAALTASGVALTNTVKPELSLTSSVAAATFKVKINYVAGYGINIWNSYTHPHWTGKRAQHGTKWTVYQTAYDKKGRKWYRIGSKKWILAKYTKKVSTSTKTSTTSTSSQASSKLSAVVTLAKAQIGKKYVWGATGPNSFDCSGLTQYVYQKAAGINITRTTYTQVNQGKTVSLKSLQPGDLLFWGSKTAPYHVAIYIGNNQYVNAATPSQGVVKQTISTYYYPSIAKRIIY
ncbi:C40 family peptidase [Lactobacillus corticis]|uniref:Cell wall-associated hydrolase n=1 Tax=Lactobacillus corticis TaxID=2201249 RepID=A0A916QGZ9_9LACO|nr:C40 family peptidase [Lactobacillus corticis]GFZ26799.1 cell wall-associated hydrolase [Lactobacillus corticis]